MHAYSQFSDNITTDTVTTNIAGIDDAIRYSKTIHPPLSLHTTKQTIGNDAVRPTNQSTSSTYNNHAAFYLPLRGTIIPKEWKALTNSSGKKLSRGALELYAIIVSWYNCKKVIDKETGKYKFVPKFEGDELKKNYDYFTKELDRSQEQVRRYFAELKSANLATVELRTVTHKNWRYHNTLCITLNKEAGHFIKTQDASIQTTDKVDSCNKSSQDNLQTTTNPSLISSLEDKKIWPSPFKKVDSAVQKSGALYIDKTTLKTNIKIDLIDLGESNFVKKDFSEKEFQSQIFTQESKEKHYLASGVQFSNEIVLGQGDVLKTPNSLPRKLLLEFYPLLEQDAIELRKASGREFNLNYINKLLLKLSKEKPDHGFYTKPLFLSYMSKVLACELRQAPIVNNIDFTFAVKPRTTEYELKHKTNYLDKIERSTDISLSSQLKRKIVGRFCSDEAYDILTQCNFIGQAQTDPQDSASLVRSEYLIQVPGSITTLQKATLSQIVKEVFGQDIKVTFNEQESKRVMGQGDALWYNKSPESKPISPSSPLWQKIRESLQKRYGDAIDKSWFSKIDIEQNPDTQKIYIKSPTTFVRDWVKTNYSEVIEKAIQEIAKEAKELLPEIDTTDKRYDLLEWRVG